MNDGHDDPATGSPELVLERRHSPLPSPALRGRVLAAVDDVLADGLPAPYDAGDGLPWVVAATIMAGLLVAPWLAAATHEPLPSRSGFVASLAGRTVSAGLSADILPPDSPPGSPRLASAPPRVDDGGPEPARFHPLVFRRALEGDF